MVNNLITIYFSVLNDIDFYYYLGWVIDWTRQNHMLVVSLQGTVHEHTQGNAQNSKKKLTK